METLGNNLGKTVNSTIHECPGSFSEKFRVFEYCVSLEGLSMSVGCRLRYNDMGIDNTYN